MAGARFTALHRQSASEQVYRVLREKIEDGSLAPGEHLADGELAESLGVSRTPVREALRRLVDQGAVRTEPGRHTRVADAEQEQAWQVFPLLSVLHEFATTCAIGRLDAEDFAEMTEANERMRLAAEQGDTDGARDADKRFHAVLLRRAENPYLSTVIDMISLHTRRLEALYFRDPIPAAESHHQHERIIEALRARDETLAGELVRANTKRGPWNR